MDVAERIAAPQRPSSRTVYKSKWPLFEKWCRENSVDFSAPSIKQVSNFFMYLYQDLNRSTIDGYRMTLISLKARTLTSYCPSSTGTDPKVTETYTNLPKWNLSVVLNKLTKAPFEPMKDTDLKHLTLKIAFLLVLVFGHCGLAGNTLV